MPALNPYEMSGGLHPHSVIPPNGPSSAEATDPSRDKSQQKAPPSAPNAPPSSRHPRTSHNLRRSAKQGNRFPVKPNSPPHNSTSNEQVPLQQLNLNSPSQPELSQNAEDPPIRTSSMRPPEQPSPVTAHRPTQKEFDEFSKKVCARVWKTNLGKLFDKVVQAVPSPSPLPI